MTEQNQNATKPTEKKPRVVKHRDERIKDLREDIAALEAKLNALLQDAANEEAIANIEAGSEVAYVYGRAPQRRVLSGVVRAAGKNAAGLLQLKVEFGSGLDAEFHLIDAGSLLLNADQIDAAKVASEQANAEALAAKAEKEKGKAP